MADDRNARVVLSADVSQYQQQMSNAAQSTQQLAGNIEQAKTAHESLMKSAAISLENFSKNIRAFQYGMSAITATLQKQMSTIEGVFGSRTVSGKSIQGTGKEVENMRAGIKKLTGELPVARGEIVQLMTSISKMGVTSSDTINGLTANFLRLSAATGESAPGLAQGMIGLSKQMGTLRPEQRNADGTPIVNNSGYNANVQTNVRMNDSLNSLSANAGVSAQGILDFSQQIAPAGRSAGMSQAEVMGTSTAFIAGGADGGFAASAFQTILNEISMMRSTNSEQLGKYSAALGITGKELEKLTPFDIAKQIIQIIGSGPQGISKANMMGFDGPRMMKALQAVNAAGGIDKFTNDAAMSYGSGSTEAGAAAASSGLFDELDKLKEKFTDIGDSVGSTILPIFQALAKATNMLISPFKALGDWLGVFTGILGGITKLGATFLHLMSMAGTLALIATLSKTSFAKRFQEGRAAKEEALTYNRDHGLFKGDKDFKTGADFTKGEQQRAADAENARHNRKPGDKDYRTAADFSHISDDPGRLSRVGGWMGRTTGPDPFKKVREWRPGRTGAHYLINATADLMGWYANTQAEWTARSAATNPDTKGNFSVNDPQNRLHPFRAMRDAEGNKMPGFFKNLAHGWGVGRGTRSMLSVGVPGAMSETVFEAEERVTKENIKRMQEQDKKIADARKAEIDPIEKALKKDLKKNANVYTPAEARLKTAEADRKIQDINDRYDSEEKARRKARGEVVTEQLKRNNAIDRELKAGNITPEEARAQKAASNYEASRQFVDAKRGGIGGWAERNRPREGENLTQLMRRRITEEGGLRTSTARLSAAFLKASTSALALAGGLAAAKGATLIGRGAQAVGSGIRNIAEGAWGLMGGPAGIAMTGAGMAWKLTQDLQKAAVTRGTINSDKRQIMTEDSYNLQTKYNVALGESVVSLASFKQGLDATKPALDQNSVTNSLNDPTLADRGRTKTEYTDERVKDVKTEQDALAYLTGMGPMSPNAAAMAVMDLYKTRNFDDATMKRIKDEYTKRTQGGKSNPTDVSETSLDMTTKLANTLGGNNPMRAFERSGGVKAGVATFLQQFLNEEVNDNGTALGKVQTAGDWNPMMFVTNKLNTIAGHVPGLRQGKEWLSRTAGSVAQSSIAEDPRFQNSVGITYANMVAGAEGKANETNLDSLGKDAKGKKIDQKTVKQLLLVESLSKRMGELADKKNQAVKEGGEGSNVANALQAEMNLLKDSAEQAGLSLGDRTVDKISISTFDEQNTKDSYTQQFRDAFLGGSKVGDKSLRETSDALGITDQKSALKWHKDLKPAQVLNEVQNSMNLIKLVGKARTLIEKDKELQRVLSDTDMNPVAVASAIEKLTSSGASYDDLKAYGYTRSPGSSSQQVAFAAAQQMQAQRSEMSPVLSMPARLGETVTKANEALTAFGRDNQSVDAVKESKSEIRSQLISLVSALQDFAKSKSREAEDFNQARIDSANAFHLQMQYGEEDYQRQMRYSEDDFYRQREHSQNEFQIQMARSRENYLRQEKYMFEDNAKGIYDVYTRIQGDVTQSAETVLSNMAEQQEAMIKQRAQLEELKARGLDQNTIDVLKLNDPTKAQELNRLYGDIQADPTLLKKLMAAAAAQAKAAGLLVNNEDNTALRRQREEFARTTRNTIADQKRAMDWGLKEYRIQITRTDEAHKISVNRQIAGYMLNISIQDRERKKMLRRMDADFLEAARYNSMTITQLFKEAGNLITNTLGEGGDAMLLVIGKMEEAYKRILKALKEGSPLTVEGAAAGINAVAAKHNKSPWKTDGKSTPLPALYPRADREPSNTAEYKYRKEMDAQDTAYERRKRQLKAIAMDENRSYEVRKRAVDNYAATLKDEIQRLNDSGASQEEVTKRAAYFRDSLLETTKALFKNDTAAQNYTSSIKLMPTEWNTTIGMPGVRGATAAADHHKRAVRDIPTTWKTKIVANVGQAVGSIDRVYAKLKRIKDLQNVGTLTWSGVNINNLRRAHGGLITGPGTKTSDSVPVAASNGEYVIKAASVDKYGIGFMDAINKGEISHRSSGGPVNWNRPGRVNNNRSKFGWLDSGDRGTRAPDGKYYGGFGGPSWGDYWAKHPGQWALKKAGLDWEHGGPKNNRLIDQVLQMNALDNLSRSKRNIIEDVVRAMNVANKGITGAYAKQAISNYYNSTNFNGDITIKSNDPMDMARQLQQLKRSRTMRGLSNIGA